MGKRVIGVAGQIGAGKDTLAHLIESLLGATFLNISDIVRAEAKAHGIADERKLLTDFAARMFAEQGKTYFVDRLIDQVLGSEGAYFVVSGIRTEVDVRAFQAKFVQGFSLVSVAVLDKKLRHERIRNRGVGDPQDEATLDHNDAEQYRIFGISKVADQAELHADNSLTLEDLVAWVRANAANLSASSFGAQ